MQSTDNDAILLVAALQTQLNNVQYAIIHLVSQ